MTKSDSLTSGNSMSDTTIKNTCNSTVVSQDVARTNRTENHPSFSHTQSDDNNSSTPVVVSDDIFGGCKKKIRSTKDEKTRLKEIKGNWNISRFLRQRGC